MIISIIMSLIFFVVILSYNLESYPASFDLECDDYCIPSPNTDVCVRKHFTQNIDISNLEFSIKMVNSGVSFTMRGMVNFTFFSIRTTDYHMWKFGKPGELCYDDYPNVEDFTPNYYTFQFWRSDTKYDNQNCTTTFSLKICKNETIYISEDLPEIELLNDELFKVMINDYAEPHFQFITIPTTGQLLTQQRNLINVNDYIESKNSPIYIRQSNHYSSDLVSFAFRDDENTVVFDHCEFNIVVCGRHCKMCNYLIVDNPVCLECKDNYAFKVGDNHYCYLITENIPNYYYDVIENKFKECYSICETCSNGGNEDNHNCNSCKDSLYLYSTQCVTNCKDNNAYLNDDNTCTDTCNNFIIETPIENYCTSSCVDFDSSYKYTYVLPNGTISCKQNCNDYNYYRNDTMECIDSCSDSIIDRGEGSIECVSECVEPYKYSSINTNGVEQCYIECPDNLYSNSINECITKEECINNGNFIIKTGNNKGCYSSCPNPYIANIITKECEFDLFVTPVNSTHGTTDVELETILDNIDKYVPYYKDLDLNINGPDYKLQIYSPNDPLYKDDTISSINLTECLTLLKKKHNIQNDEDLIKVKVDIIDKSNPTNKVEYKVYNKDGELLPLDICENLNSIITYPLNESPGESFIDYDIAEEMFNEYGINIFNASDPFYNDICNIYRDSNGNEIPIEERRKRYFQNFTFCEAHCNLLNIDYNMRNAKCECQIIPHNDNNTNETLIINTYKQFNDIGVSQLKLFECTNLLLDPNNLKLNLGFWTGLTGIICLIIIIIIHFCYEMKYLPLRFFNLIKHNPPLKIKTNKSKTDDYFDTKEWKKDIPKLPIPLPLPIDPSDKSENTKKTLSISESRQSFGKLYSTITTQGKETLKYNKNYSTNLYFHSLDCDKKHIDDYPYISSIDKDKRSFCTIYKDKLIAHNIFISIFAISSHTEYDITAIKLSIFLFDTLLGFELCCLFFPDEIVTIKLTNETIDMFIIPLRYVLVIIVQYIITRLIKMIRMPYFLLDLYANELKNPFFLGLYLKKTLHRISVLSAILYILESLIIIVIWIYMSIFCIVRRSFQFYWFYNTLIAFCISYGISFMFLFLLTCFRYYGVKNKNKGLYNFELRARNLV